MSSDSDRPMASTLAGRLQILHELLYSSVLDEDGAVIGYEPTGITLSPEQTLQLLETGTFDAPLVCEQPGYSGTFTIRP